jgi:hypothetical protein
MGCGVRFFATHGPYVPLLLAAIGLEAQNQMNYDDISLVSSRAATATVTRKRQTDASAWRQLIQSQYRAPL